MTNSHTQNRPISYYLPTWLIEAIKAEAEKQRRSASSLVWMVLEEWMKKEKEKEKC